ncbi:MAG: threonylcarbamoyl-AMP synthase [Fibrobacter sp.]|nr:threonylcarbamoyl-AMP synthase [Fibrobacter sp.]
MIVQYSAETLEQAAQIIQSGGLVAFPTETVYGLGADGTNAAAVAKIFEAKNRPSFDPLIVHIAELSWLFEIAETVPHKAQTLIDKFWPGPLTVVLPKKRIIPDIVTAGLSGVGIRMPANDISRQLIHASGTPIAAPSANKFSQISPTTADHVREQLDDSVNLIIDGGPCSVGVESTIVSFMEPDPLLLRPGGLPMEEIEEIIGPLRIPAPHDCESASPGRSLRHYAPLTRLLLVDNYSDIPSGLSVGLLSFGPVKNPGRFQKIEVLSEKSDLREAACNLFASMRRLDAAHLDLIVTSFVPDNGIGRAINDRLKRACTNRNRE